MFFSLQECPKYWLCIWLFSVYSQFAVITWTRLKKLCPYTLPQDLSEDTDRGRQQPFLLLGFQLLISQLVIFTLVFAVVSSRRLQVMGPYTLPKDPSKDRDRDRQQPFLLLIICLRVQNSSSLTLCCVDCVLNPCSLQEYPSRDRQRQTGTFSSYRILIIYLPVIPHLHWLCILPSLLLRFPPPSSANRFPTPSIYLLPVLHFPTTSRSLVLLVSSFLLLLVAVLTVLWTPVKVFLERQTGIDRQRQTGIFHLK